MCVGDRCVVRYTVFIFRYVIISVILMMIFHIHLAVIHTFSTSVSCQDCMKLQFRRLHPQICRVEYTQNRTALVKGFSSKPKHFFSRDLMCILRSKVLGMAWAELLPPFIGLLLLRGWLLSVFIFSTSKLYKNMQHTSWPKSMWN